MLLTEEEAKTKWCAIQGCIRPMTKKGAKGMCHYHYKRSLTGKRIEGPDYQYLKKCSVHHCDDPVSKDGCRGMCSMHYSRWRLKTRPMDAPRVTRGHGWVSSHGYRYFGKKAEHRAIAESALGRSLSYNEIVHHRDGNPLNNTRDNLMVMDRGDHVRAHTLGKCNAARLAEKEQYGFVKSDHSLEIGVLLSGKPECV